MILTNATKKTTLSKDLKEARSFKDKLFGLIDARNPRSLLFKTRFGLHTFFMATPIDVLVLNEKHKVTKIKSSLMPYRFFFYNPIYSIVIELPSGTLKKTNTTVGDKIFIE